MQFTLVLTIVPRGHGDLLFLRNLRATLIPGAAVPLSLLGAFAVMYLLATASIICR